MAITFTEENGAYQIDCTQAVWATDQVHSEYQAAKIFLCDVDFIIETNSCIYLVEYKNANIPNAANPGAFRPSDPKKIDNIAKKFFDTLHYLSVSGKNKPINYVFIVDFPHAGAPERKLLRNKISDRLPFKLQQGKLKKIINDFNVVSISEWNQDPKYSNFPLLPIPAP